MPGWQPPTLPDRYPWRLMPRSPTVLLVVLGNRMEGSRRWRHPNDTGPKMLDTVVWVSKDSIYTVKMIILISLSLWGFILHYDWFTFNILYSCWFQVIYIQYYLIHLDCSLLITCASVYTNYCDLEHWYSVSGYIQLVLDFLSLK